MMNTKTAVWVDPAIAFVQNSLPRTGSEGEWDHMFTSPYQMGCEALVAFGVAEETDRGVRPLTSLRQPRILPRWDDICAVVLGLAEQRDLLSYRLPDGRESRYTAAWWGRRAYEVVPPPNIDPAHGLGPAWAAPQVMPVLHALDLVEDSAWTAAAETVLWREQPVEWRMDITSDPRFIAARDQATSAMPDDIRAELQRLVTITEDDLIEGLARRKAYQQDLLTVHGPGRVNCQPLTVESVRRGLLFVRRHQLDWVLFTCWRLHDGWLGPEERLRALEIFHDPLAIMMRQAVIARLYPDLPELAR